MRTSFHHQPEAQHPKSSAINKPAGRLPHLVALSGHCEAQSAAFLFSDLFLRTAEYWSLLAPVALLNFGVVLFAHF